MKKLLASSLFIIASAVSASALANNIVGLEITPNSAHNSLVFFETDNKLAGFLPEPGTAVGSPPFPQPYNNFTVTKVMLDGKDITSLCHITVPAPYTYLKFSILNQVGKENCIVIPSEMPPRAK